MSDQRFLLKTALKSLFDALVAIGFARSLDRDGRQVAVKTLDADTLGWIGLNMGTKPSIHVNPIVGVRNQKVERIVASLLQEPFRETLPATVAGNIGYLSGGGNSFKSVSLASASEIRDGTKEVIEDIRLRGLPFMEANRNLGHLRGTLDGISFSGIPEQVAMRRPVVLQLLGRPSEGVQVVQEWEAKLGERRDPAAERYRRFARAFREDVSAKSPGVDLHHRSSPPVAGLDPRRSDSDRAVSVIVVSRELLSTDLRTYGEDFLARRALSLDDNQMQLIGERAAVYATTGKIRLIAEALTRAAIEVLEGTPRDPRWRRRRLKGIYPGH